MIDRERLRTEMKSWKCPVCSTKMNVEQDNEREWPSANSFIKCQCGWSGMVWEVALDSVRSSLAVVLRQVGQTLGIVHKGGIDTEAVIRPLVVMLEARPDINELMKQLEE